MGIIALLKHCGLKLLQVLSTHLLSFCRLAGAGCMMVWLLVSLDSIVLHAIQYYYELNSKQCCQGLIIG